MIPCSTWYRNVWLQKKSRSVFLFCNAFLSLSVFVFFFSSEICELTGIKKEDVSSTLMNLDLIPYYKGAYIIVVQEKHHKMHEEFMAKRVLAIDPNCLKWTIKDWTRRRF